MNLSSLRPPAGQKHRKKRIGRGMGSGRGKTSTRGSKGARSISGYSIMRGIEGGQMPLHRRLPKRGFTNIFKKENIIVKVSDLERFDNGANVDEAAMRSAGLVRGRADSIKVLSDGKLTKKLTVHANKFSDAARKQIESAGGTCQETKQETQE